MIKFWAKIYQWTGWYSPFARVVEYRYIDSILPKIEQEYLSEDNDRNLAALIGLHKGLWQAHNGFHRSMKSGDIKKRLKKIKKRNRK